VLHPTLPHDNNYDGSGVQADFTRSKALASIPRWRTCCVRGHKLVSHAEQVPQYILCDKREMNQHGTVVEIVVGHVVNIGSRREQFGAVVEVNANHKRTPRVHPCMLGTIILSTL